MAIFYPAEKPASFASDPTRDGEAEVWDALARLSDSYHVFWSLNTIKDSRPHEIDFLVAHKSLGLLAIEVKGGIIQCGPIYDRAARWRGRTRGGKNGLGKAYTLKNPYWQAVGGLMALLDEWRRSAGIPPGVRFPCGYMAALPHTQRPEDDQAWLKDKRWRFVFKDDLESMPGLVTAAMRGSQEPGQSSLDGRLKDLVRRYGQQHGVSTRRLGLGLPWWWPLGAMATAAAGYMGWTWLSANHPELFWKLERIGQQVAYVGGRLGLWQ